jgi:hypothetical protein
MTFAGAWHTVRDLLADLRRHRRLPVVQQLADRLQALPSLQAP